MIDCMNVEIYRGKVEVARGFAPFERMTTGAFVDFVQSPIRLIQEFTKYDGTLFIMILTDYDIYAHFHHLSYSLLTPLYAVGTISVSADGLTVTGVGTTWTTNVKVGDRLQAPLPNGWWAGVQSVDSDTQLTLSSPLQGAPLAAGSTYSVRKLFTPTAPPSWQATVVNDEFLFTNLQDGLFSWDGVSGSAISLSASPVDAPHAAAIQADSATGRPIVGSTIEASEPFPIRVRWPRLGTNDDWDEMPGSEAGYQDITSAPDEVLRILPLGSYNVVYKRQSIHILTYIGLPFVYSRQQVVSHLGLVGPLAVADLGDIHVLLTTEGFKIFNGSGLKAFGEAVFDRFQDTVDALRIQETTAWVNRDRGYCYFIVPTLDGKRTTFVFHWRLKHEAWTLRELPATAVGSVSKLLPVRWSDKPMQDEWRWPAAGDSTWLSTDPSGQPEAYLFGMEDGRLMVMGGQSFANLPIVSRVQFGLVGAEGDDLSDEYTKGLDSLQLFFEPTVTPPSTVEVRIGTLNTRGFPFAFVMYPVAAYAFSDASHPRRIGLRTKNVSAKWFSLQLWGGSMGPQWRLHGYALWTSVLGQR
jgi:hypothetical protein